MRRNVLNSPRLSELKKHRQRIILNKILFLLLGFLAIFLFLVFISRIKALNISEIEIVGNKVVDTDAIKTSVQGEMAGKYFWVFPKSNMFFYPENAIKNDLRNKFKRLQSVSLSIKDNKILEISVVERTAEYLWCGLALPVDTTQEKCYFADSYGYIFDEAPYFSGDVYFKLYGEIGPNFEQLISFKNILISLGLKPVALNATNDGDIQIFLSGSSLDTAPKIILRTDADFENVAENLKAALTTEPLQSKFKNNYSKLQYIDLRFGNKVYDKFK